MRLRFPGKEALLISAEVSWSEMPLIRPLDNSSTLHGKPGTGVANHKDLTFSTVIEAQGRELFPSQFSYLRCVRGGFPNHQPGTSESTSC